MGLQSVFDRKLSDDKNEWEKMQTIFCDGTHASCAVKRKVNYIEANSHTHMLTLILVWRKNVEQIDCDLNGVYGVHTTVTNQKAHREAKMAKKKPQPDTPAAARKYIYLSPPRPHRVRAASFKTDPTACSRLCAGREREREGIDRHSNRPSDIFAR